VEVPSGFSSFPFFFLSLSDTPGWRFRASVWFFSPKIRYPLCFYLIDDDKERESKDAEKRGRGK
jgi:hypothetical protein